MTLERRKSNIIIKEVLLVICVNDKRQIDGKSRDDEAMIKQERSRSTTEAAAAAK